MDCKKGWCWGQGTRTNAMDSFFFFLNWWITGLLDNEVNWWLCRNFKGLQLHRVRPGMNSKGGPSSKEVKFWKPKEWGALCEDFKEKKNKQGLSHGWGTGTSKRQNFNLKGFWWLTSRWHPTCFCLALSTLFFLKNNCTSSVDENNIY